MATRNPAQQMVGSQVSHNELAKRPRIGETLIQGFLFLCGAISILTTVGIVYELGKEALLFFRSPDVTLGEFFTSTHWQPAILDFGIWPLVLATVFTSFIAMLVALPLGLGTAIFLSEYASEKARNILKPILEVLAGIPTVVYGYFALTFMTPLGLSQAVTVRVGRAHGRRDAEELHAAALAGMLLAGVAVIATITAFLTIPGFLIGLFVDPTDPARPAILATGVSLLAVAALFQLVDFGQVMALGMLRGVQDTRVPMIMALVSYWLIGLPVSYVMGFELGLGGVGVWLGLTVGLAAACIGMQTRFWTRYPATPRRS